ncbi:MAG: bifunctional methylenetetrahydrofolate dehydrogenase/methenyltetrahydrofolate cyclohydrolase FolD [Negativibacillus sp.]|nr:bifunctional methylenetetrahydrofolate dehydrogenase/methenyltetrahydrofolate cyclohydrolase FolD [Negativibacillus sp.]
MATIMDGKALSLKLKEQMKQRIAQLKQQGINPKLVVVLVGDNSASQVYVRNKHKSCGEVGIESEVITMPEQTTQQELLEVVERLNQDETVDGILVQLPLPKQIDEKTVLRSILPEKDVDGFHPVNVGLLSIGDECFAPATPSGIIAMFQEYGIDIAGKNCVIIGRSNIVGKPMAALLLKNHATVTICHSKTEDLASYTRRADVVIVATGHRHTLTADMVKEGAVVVDVGMNRNEQGKLCGDVDYEEVKEKASFITPVPGGVGPMTITELLENTIQAAQRHHRAAK